MINLNYKADSSFVGEINMRIDIQNKSLRQLYQIGFVGPVKPVIQRDNYGFVKHDIDSNGNIKGDLSNAGWNNKTYNIAMLLGML